MKLILAFKRMEQLKVLARPEQTGKTNFFVTKID